MKTIWERFTDGFTLKKDHMDRTWRCHLFFWNLQYSSTDRNYRRSVLGMMLLINHWFGISPSVITPILDISCYLLAFKYLGGRFIKISIISTLSVFFVF